MGSHWKTSLDASDGYGNNVHAAESPVRPQIAVTALTSHAETVGHWARERDLQISAPKSNITLFISDTHQSHLHPTVVLNSILLPLERRPKLPGVKFDPHLTFTPHIQTKVERASARLKILKALSGTN